jgi:aryl sulfotransferase
MPASGPNQPVKTREFHNHHFDSTAWNRFRVRDDDITVTAYAKAGTTWTHRIIAQLLFEDSGKPPVSDMSPRLGLRVPPTGARLAALEARTRRRFIETHVPLDALAHSPHFERLGVPGRTRTCDPRFRKPMLYPAELRGHNYFSMN